MFSDSRCRGSTSSAFGLVTVSGCAPYAAVDIRRPSFPGCRLASLEQSATSRHVCTVTACFLQSSEDSSLRPQFSLTILLCLRIDTRHYGHFNRCSYLLTYLLTLIHKVLLPFGKTELWAISSPSTHCKQPATVTDRGKQWDPESQRYKVEKRYEQTTAKTLNVTTQHA